MKTKICKKYGLEKPFDDFLKDKEYKDGYRTNCKSCRNIINKEYINKNKEKIKIYKKEYAKINKDKIKDYLKSYLRPMWATTRKINGIVYEGNLNRVKKIINT